MKLKLLIFLLLTVLSGCANIPIEHDLPYGDPEWEFRIMWREMTAW